MIKCKEGALSDRIAFGLLCLKFLSWSDGGVVGRATLHVSAFHSSAEDECWKGWILCWGNTPFHLLWQVPQPVNTAKSMLHIYAAQRQMLLLS
jgi:hypothetical protein